MLNTKKIIRSIIKRRKALGWSQAELARKINMSAAAISLLEKGLREPSLLTAVKLARVFKISLEELLLTDNFAPSKELIHQFYTRYGKIQDLSLKNIYLVQALIEALLKE